MHDPISIKFYQYLFCNVFALFAFLKQPKLAAAILRSLHNLKLSIAVANVAKEWWAIATITMMLV
jgi:hypothetical protein